MRFAKVALRSLTLATLFAKIVKTQNNLLLVERLVLTGIRHISIVSFHVRLLNEIILSLSRLTLLFLSDNIFIVLQQLRSLLFVG